MFFVLLLVLSLLILSWLILFLFLLFRLFSFDYSLRDQFGSFGYHFILDWFLLLNLWLHFWLFLFLLYYCSSLLLWLLISLLLFAFFIFLIFFIVLIKCFFGGLLELFWNVSDCGPILGMFFLLSSQFDEKSSGQNFFIIGVFDEIDGIYSRFENDLERPRVIFFNFDQLIIWKSLFNIFFGGIEIALDEIKRDILNFLRQVFDLFYQFLLFRNNELFLFLCSSLHSQHKFMDLQIIQDIIQFNIFYCPKIFTKSFIPLYLLHQFPWSFIYWIFLLIAFSFIKLIMSKTLGFGLIALGLSIKATVRLVRHIRKRQYLDPLRMYPGGFYNQMTRREAQLILGVMQNMDPPAIKAKHRNLMLNNHPDNGGSTYLATKINQAKDMLLNG